ncbi:dihydroorotate dehydrogenase [Trapelia coarctata]|nr:dihydroorotate dehydrogenase [Trapelia coarctata]
MGEDRKTKAVAPDQKKPYPRILMVDYPLLNSANVWASTEEELEELYRAEYAGAITIRTSLLNGFQHDDKVHQYCLFDFNSPSYKHDSKSTGGKMDNIAPSSLNTLGYSPVPLREYIQIISDLELPIQMPQRKPVIFSVTGSVEEVVQCYQLLEQKKNPVWTSWMMEINLSCPNIPNKPPPAYSRNALVSYLMALRNHGISTVPVGIKTPPYTYQGQFDDLISALLEVTSDEQGCPVSFITATNTLGSCFVPGPTPGSKAIQSPNGSGIGGLAGAALHPLALGNVRTIRKMLDQHECLEEVDIIGVGGVSDGAGMERMMEAGATYVAVGTALGNHGVSIFERIADEWDQIQRGKIERVR